MKVATRVVVDVGTDQILCWEGYDYSGPVAECKAKKAKKLAETQLAAMNKYIAELLSLQKQAILPILPELQAFIKGGGRGFSPEALAAMRGQALEGTTARFGELEGRLKTMLARRGAAGGDVPVSGDFMRTVAGLESAKEMGVSDALREVTLKDELLRLQNLFAAAGALTGAGSVFRPDPFIGGASDALGTRANLSIAGLNQMGQIISGVSQGAGTALGGWAGG